MNGHAWHGCDSLIPRITVCGALDVGSVPVSLAVLGPCATCLRVVALHAGTVTKFLDVVRIARCVTASSVGAGAVASSLGET